MVDDAIIQRITKLLRIARDQKGRPEGRTALKHARILMQKHGIEVELQEREDFEATQAQLSIEPEPIAWVEYLGTTLATAYRCECMSRWSGVAWQFWIYAHEYERVATCRDHYQFLEEQIRNRARTMADRLLHTKYRDEARFQNRVQSYAEGLVFEASTQLLRLLGWEGNVPFMEDGFDLDHYNATTRDPLMPEDEEDHEPGLRRFRYRAPPDPPFEVELQDGPPAKVMSNDAAMFARGCKDGRYLSLVPSRLKDAFH